VSGSWEAEEEGERLMGDRKVNCSEFGWRMVLVFVTKWRRELRGKGGDFLLGVYR
jgi:hypothetical protein